MATKQSRTPMLILEPVGVVARAIHPLTARITDRDLHAEARGLQHAAERVAKRRVHASP